MSILFSGNEIVDIAVRIEENGHAFYNAAAERSNDQNLAAILRKLADDETEHKNTFKALYKSDENYILSPAYTEEVDSYIKAMTNSQVFAPGKSSADIAKGAKDIFEVLSLAMGAEKDSILYYSEIKDWVQEKDKDIINNVIEEEKKHLKELTELHKSIKGGCCA
jgi:rubrerythrin